MGWISDRTGRGWEVFTSDVVKVGGVSDIVKVGRGESSLLHLSENNQLVLTHCTVNHLEKR